MQNALANKTRWAVVLAVLIMSIVAFLFAEHAQANPTTVAFETSASATTSLSYMVPGTGTATTTFQFDSPSFSAGKVANMQFIDATALYIQYVASSTTAGLEWQVQYSNNNIDWYGENQSIGAALGSASLQQEASTTVTHIWVPGVAATSTKVVILPAVPAQHERVQFFTAPGLGNGAIYEEVDLKTLSTTP
jgi:hypothetical protein